MDKGEGEDWFRFDKAGVEEDMPKSKIFHQYFISPIVRRPVLFLSGGSMGPALSMGVYWA